MSSRPASRRQALDEWMAHPVWSWLGIVVTEVSDQGATLAIDVQPHHRGGGGTSAVNGAVIAALVDASAGAAAAATNWPPHNVTIDLGVSYLRPMTGNRIEATGRVISAGRQIAFVEVDVRSEDGQVAAVGRATMRLFTRPLRDPEEATELALEKDS